MNVHLNTSCLFLQVVDVPVDAKVSNESSHCGEGIQTLSLNWKERALNDTTVMLDRNITIIFEVKPNTT